MQKRLCESKLESPLWKAELYRILRDLCLLYGEIVSPKQASLLCSQGLSLSADVIESSQGERRQEMQKIKVELAGTLERANERMEADDKRLLQSMGSAQEE